MKFYTLKTLSSQEVTSYEIENLSTQYEGRSIPDGVRTKEEYMEWAKAPTTDHCFYSTIEASSPSVRIGTSNTPLRVHGFVADYDSDISDSELVNLGKRINPNEAPTFTTKTFSGRARLVWVFTEPIPFFSEAFYKAFIKKFVKEAQVKRLLPGFDETGLAASHYFELGTAWRKIGEPVSKAMLFHWSDEVSKKIQWKADGISIPIDKLAEELEDKFPGRWLGQFDIGARGCRFWDDSANNNSAAIVREGGMQCFTGDRPFVPWSSIFGGSFIEKFRADRIGEAIADCWFDGRNYWRTTPDGVWRACTGDDIKLFLAVDKGLTYSKDRSEDVSEVNLARAALMRLKAVDGALPFAGRPTGIIHYNGKRFLNTSWIKPIEAMQCTTEEAALGCPFILKLIHELFGPEQLPYFLAHLKRGYVAQVNRTPCQGQFTVMCGGVGIGKTFLTNVIIGKLHGGFADGSAWLTGETQFNSGIAPFYIVTVDDTQSSSDTGRHNKWSANLKRFAANPVINYNAKFRDAHDIPFSGRLYITCNADAESMRILPDTDQSILDKMHLFLLNALSFKFPVNPTAIVDRELPYFARWLSNYIPLTSTENEARFGVKCYHHAELVETARAATHSHSFRELLVIFLRKEGETKPWEGTSTELLQEMLADDTLRDIAQSYKSVTVGRALGQLMNQGYPISQLRNKVERVWVIKREFFAELEGSVN